MMSLARLVFMVWMSILASVPAVLADGPAGTPEKTQPEQAPVNDPPPFDLFFLSERSGSTQLHRLHLSTGQVEQITRHYSPVHGPRWLPGRQEVVVAPSRTAAFPE